MSRSAALLLFCSLAACAAIVGAPAPAPKPWVVGWDRPVDPVGDCRFDRDGDRLTITVPGKGHDLRLYEGWLNAPRRLRAVSGDFSLRVRLTVGDSDADASCSAGLLLLSKRNNVSNLVKLNFTAWEKKGKVDNGVDYIVCSTAEGGEELGKVYSSSGGVANVKGMTVELEIQRKGRKVTAKCGPDGERTWEFAGAGLPQTVRVGVFAEWAVPYEEYLRWSQPGPPPAVKARRTFRAVFDQFRLTPLPGPNK